MVLAGGVYNGTPKPRVTMIANTVSISMAGSNRINTHVISKNRATRPSDVAKCKELKNSRPAGFADDRSDPVAATPAGWLDPSSFISDRFSCDSLISRPQTATGSKDNAIHRHRIHVAHQRRRTG